MFKNFRKKTSNLFLTVFIGFIVISFMFTGYETMRGTPDTVASVGGEAIKFRDYQSEFNRQLEFYSQFINGGKALSSKQIKDFNLKEGTLRNLVNSQLIRVLGHKLGILVPSEDIRQTIKQQEFFKTNEVFDLAKYKAILAANQMQPADYENIIEKDLIFKKTSSLIKIYPVSNQLLADIQKFKTQNRKATLIRLERKQTQKLFQLKKSEITSYLKQKNNAENVRFIFDKRRSSLEQPEKITARHILLQAKKDESDAQLKKRVELIAKKTNSKNFAQMAEKYTEEPDGKKRQGSLGTFARGRMVPEFEQVAFSLKPMSLSKPVKTKFGYHLILVTKKYPRKKAQLHEHQHNIAKELIIKQKRQEVTTFINSIAAEIEKRLQKGSIGELQQLQKKWNLKLEKNIIINRYEGSKGSISLSSDQINKIFKHSSTGFDRFDNAAHITFAKSSPQKNANPKKASDQTRAQELKTTQLGYANKMQQAMTKILGDSINVRIYDDRIP